LTRSPKPPLFERYLAARESARATGAITILVSHRFSTVRMADVIVVLERGRITEYGSHEQLMRNGGLYAQLFEMQAQAYR
jgi:ATP-binding cassette, subfamily B, bacterial